MFLARSYIPKRPRCKFCCDRTACGSMPQPLSRMITPNLPGKYTTSTSILVALEWWNALAIASRPIR